MLGFFSIMASLLVEGTIRWLWGMNGRITIGFNGWIQFQWSALCCLHGMNATFNQVVTEKHVPKNLLQSTKSIGNVIKVHGIKFNVLRATSHTSQEPWPRSCESPKESVLRPSQDISKIMHRGHKPSSVMWSHAWPSPQLNVISMNSYSHESSHMIT